MEWSMLSEVDEFEILSSSGLLLGKHSIASSLFDGLRAALLSLLVFCLSILFPGEARE